MERTRLLLKTRTSAAIGALATAYVLVLAIQALFQPPHIETGWWTTSPWLPTWLMTTVNVVLYAGFCWAAIWFMRDSRGRERVFLGIWCAGMLLSPLKRFGLEWTVAIRWASAVGLVIALLLAISFVFPRSKAD